LNRGRLIAEGKPAEVAPTAKCRKCISAQAVFSGLRMQAEGSTAPTAGRQSLDLSLSAQRGGGGAARRNGAGKSTT
jgi:hypothetical protein